MRFGDQDPFIGKRRKTDRAVGEKPFFTGCDVIGGAPTLQDRTKGEISGYEIDGKITYWYVRVCDVVSVILNVWLAPLLAIAARICRSGMPLI